MPTILVGTEDGIHTAGDQRAPVRVPGRAVAALASPSGRSTGAPPWGSPDPSGRSTGAPPWGSPDPSGRSTGAPPWGSPDPSGGDGVVWALVDGRELWRDVAAGEGRAAASSPGPRLNCLAATGGTVLAGTAEAHLLRLEAGELRRVEPFDQVEGRDGWYTPWGGPPDVRSVAVGADGALWVNVHVGGIPTSPDGGRTWRPTIDVDADVHQVVTHPDDPDRVLAATASGLADSADAGRSWTYLTEGMHAGYCRAVALGGDTVVVSSSTGPRGGRATLYRRPLDAPAEAPFERCRDGLPEWFEGNIDSACVDARGPTVAFGTVAGEVFASEDAGVTWERVADGLAPVRCLLLPG